MAYSAHPTRATKVPITITSRNQKYLIVVDQTQPMPEGETFRSVGTIVLDADTETTITISNTNTDGFVILDALQLLEAL